MADIAGPDTDTPTTCAIHATPVEQYENGHGGYTILCRRCLADHEAHADHADRLAAITDEQVEAVAHALFDWKYLTGLVPWERASPEDARGFRLMAYVAIKAANGWVAVRDAERLAAITALRRPPAFDRDASSVRHGYNAALADVLAILRGTTDA